MIYVSYWYIYFYIYPRPDNDFIHHTDLKTRYFSENVAGSYKAACHTVLDTLKNATLLKNVHS